VGNVNVEGNAVSEQISCTSPSTSVCEVTLTLTVVETLNGTKVVAVAASHNPRKHGKRKIVRRTVIVGGATVSVAGGKAKLLKVMLNANGRHLLALRHRLAVKLTTSEATAGRQRKVLAQRTVTFKARGKRGRNGHQGKHDGRAKRGR
jgi:hypothetical protein